MSMDVDLDVELDVDLNQHPNPNLCSIILHPSMNLGLFAIVCRFGLVWF